MLNKEYFIFQYHLFAFRIKPWPQIKVFRTISYVWISNGNLKFRKFIIEHSSQFTLVWENNIMFFFLLSYFVSVNSDSDYCELRKKNAFKISFYACSWIFSMRKHTLTFAIEKYDEIYNDLWLDFTFSLFCEWKVQISEIKLYFIDIFFRKITNEPIWNCEVCLID